MQYIEISQGKRGRWRYNCWEDIGIGDKRICGPICSAYGYDSAEAAERAARKWFGDMYEVRVV